MFSRILTTVLLALLPGRALAADYHKAITTSTVGGLAPAAGVALVGVAFAASRGMDDNQQSAMALGSTLLALPLVVIGPPVMNGGAMRAQKALSEQGVEVTDIPGWISWGCFAGVILVGSAYPATAEADVDPIPYEIAQGSLFLAGYGAAIVQHALVRRAHGQETEASMGGVSLVPMMSTEARGLALAGRF